MRCSIGRRITAPALLASLAFLCAAQPKSPARWELTPPPSKVAPGRTVWAELKLTLDEPWHMYSLTTPPPGPDGGPIATTIKALEAPWLAACKVHAPAPARKFDPNFKIDTETYSQSALFYLECQTRAGAAAGEQELTVQTRAQFCTETECLPPRKFAVTAKLTLDPSAPESPFKLPAGYASPAAPAASAAPVAVQGEAQQGLGSFLFVAFGFGLAAIFTPCVFPMIPITMSFFLGQGQTSRSQSVVQASVFCLGIIALFTGIGFAVTAALGPFGAVQLGSSPWVNGFICLVFFAFALSLLGAFEITVPTGLLTRLNSASSGPGILPTLVMGLAFALTSFACVGPFVGTLLAGSVQGGKLQPVLGMLVFSAGLAAPFFLLALFPAYLQRMPRSGGWLARVKVVMGFLILAAMLKYLSNIDQVLHWSFLTRERFLSAWIVLFALPGLYLLGLLPLEGINRDEKPGVGRLLAAALLLVFSISLVPGLSGGKLGELEAYIPGIAGEKSDWIKNDLRAALDRARAENKLVLINFTGYACTNCHWMRANMFPRPEIAAALKDMVLVELFTDGSDAESEKNQELQNRMFQTVAIPFYAVLTPDEKVVASFAGLTKDERRFLSFLRARPAL